MGTKIVENGENPSDEEIVAQIKNGNYDRLQGILDRYLPHILFYVDRYCPQKDREDAIQEATIALYFAIKHFDSDKSSFRTFASLCIERSVLSIVRSTFRQKRVPEEMLSPLEEAEIPDPSDPEKIFLEKESYRSLANMIRLELSELEYKVLALFLFGKSYAEIADKLSVSQKSVDNALARIRKKLKK